MPFQVVFPDAHNHPTFLFESQCAPYIPFGVVVYLPFPKGDITFGHFEVFGAFMPKATVHKNGNMFGWKSHVNLVLAVLETVRVAHLSERLTHDYLWSGVSAPYFGHYFASFSFRNGIRHESTGITGILPCAGIKTHNLILMASPLQPTGLEVKT
jgi:hypothetical protein